MSSRIIVVPMSFVSIMEYTVYDDGKSPGIADGTPDSVNDVMKLVMVMQYFNDTTLATYSFQNKKEKRKEKNNDEVLQ